VVVCEFTLLLRTSERHLYFGAVLW